MNVGPNKSHSVFFSDRNIVAMNQMILEAETLIPDLLQAAPQTRPVLDRYGLRGCGGKLGPMESLSFFAGAHDVPLPRLLGELRQALTASQEHPDVPPLTADQIYRPFFLAGIAVVLTLGAAWGAYLLLRIASAEQFTAVGLHEVNAHGHAQIFGWVGLFVMGFAYQAFPRFKHTDLACPRLAIVSGVLMVTGLLFRSLGEPVASTHAWLTAAVVMAAWLEVAAIGIFVGILFTTWRRSGKPLAFYDGYVVSALLWFIIQAVYDAVYLAATLAASGRHDLLGLVAQWQGPLRDMQIHGFATLMILGVSQRMFHYFYGLPAPSERLSRWLLPVLNIAVVGEVLGLVLMRSQGHAWAGLWYCSAFVFAGSIATLVANWRIFAPPKESDRSLKFLRAAYLWLFGSLAMLVLLPFHQFVLLPLLAPEAAATQAGFSHAYYGAVRHAITVGFVSLMIVGVAAKVVPTLNGVDMRALSALWTPFVLLNLGCALRVFGQVTTDLTAAAFPFTGISGCLEVTGLALWGWHLGRLMLGWRPADRQAKAPALLPGESIRAEHRVSEVLDLYPHLLRNFLAFGFKPLSSAWLRQRLAHRVSIAQACRFLGVEAASLLADLNRQRTETSTRKVSLPVVAEGPITESSLPPTCTST